MKPLEEGNWFFVMLVDIANADEGAGESVAAARERVGVWIAGLGQSIRSRGGSVVRDLGSSLFCTFANADAATQTALVLLRKAAKDTATGPAPALRVAIHAGDLSPAVATNLVKETARMLCLCEPGRVLLSDSVAKALSPPLRQTLQPVGGGAVDAGAFRLPLWELPWGENVQATMTLRGLRAGEPATAPGEVGPTLTMVVPPPAAAVKGQPELPPDATAAASVPAGSGLFMVLSLAGRTEAVHADRSCVLLGRELDCGLVFKGDTSSRHHARIEYRNDGFYLVDQSRNGTFVYDAEGTGVHVHGAEYRLPTSGYFCPGCPVDSPEAEPVQFRFGG